MTFDSTIRSIWFACALMVSCSSSDDELPPPLPPIDVTFMNQKADPCSDFYEFACGTWIREHPVDPGFLWSRFFEGDNRNAIFFRKLLEDSEDSDPDIQKAQWYRISCMEVRRGADADLAPVQALLDEVDAVTGPAELATTVADLHLAGIDALFYVRTGVDATDPSQPLLELWGSGWSLSTREDYGGSTDVTTGYRAHVANLVPLMDVPLLDAAAVVDFEGSLAHAERPRLVLRDPLATWNPTDFSTFATSAPGFDFNTYFDHAGFGPISRLNVVDPDYFVALSTLITAAPLETLRHYLKWRVVEATADFANRAAIDEEDRFHETELFGRTQASDDWSCLSATRRVFPFALARKFIDRFVPQETRPSAIKLVEAVRDAFRKDLANVTWLDEQTRASAIDKLDNVVAQVAYPDDWPNYGSLKVTSSASYLENRFAFYRRSAAARADALTTPFNRDAWLLSPATTNAIYTPFLNTITIPVAVLQEPFFSLAWPEGLNLAALGSVIGHELTHGFDDRGRHYDGSGALRDWWTDPVDAEFRSRASCLVDQYAAYEPIPGIHIDGELTLGENIADLGGLKLAHSVYGNAKSPLPPTAGFTAEQEFFLAFAQLWCATQSDELVEANVATDPHSPSKYRVNGVVRNIPAFADAFSCQSGAPLAPAPADRCEVW